MTEHELAARERVTVRTVREWRQKGTGPKFRKLGPGRGALVRYRWVDYLAWREETVTVEHGIPNAPAGPQLTSQEDVRNMCEGAPQRKHRRLPPH
jgi:hypothetical protein